MFYSPVDEEQVPDYSSVITRPMCFESMRKKTRADKYVKWDRFWVLIFI